MTLRQLFILNAIWIMSGISLLWLVIVWMSFERMAPDEIDVLDIIGEASTILMAGIFSTFIARSNMQEVTKTRLVAAMLCFFVGGSADFIDEFFVVRHWPALLENTFKTSAALFTLWGLLSLTREAKSSERRADHFRKMSDHLGLLTQIGQRITRSQKLSDILEIVYSSINEVAKCDAFRVVLLENGEQNEKLFRQSTGTKGLDEQAMRAFQMLEAWVLNNNTSLYLFDMTRCSEQYLEAGEQSQQFMQILSAYPQLQSGSIFIVPVPLATGLVGVFTVFSTHRQALDSEQCHNIESVAAYSGVAINNAMRFEEIERRTADLKASSGVDKSAEKVETSGL